MNIIDEFGDPDGSPAARGWARIAHLILPAGIACMVFKAAEWFIDLPDWLAWLLLPITAAIVIGQLHVFLARICVRCMQDVPADAPVQAQRRRWLLRYQHLWMNWRVPAAWWIATMASIGLRRWLYGVHGGDWMLAPTDLAWFAWIVAFTFHHRVSPWCPYCKRWDDGGTHEPSPTPDPQGVKSA